MQVEVRVRKHTTKKYPSDIYQKAESLGQGEERKQNTLSQEKFNTKSSSQSTT